MENWEETKSILDRIDREFNDTPYRDIPDGETGEYLYILECIACHILEDDSVELFDMRYLNGEPFFQIHSQDFGYTVNMYYGDSYSVKVRDLVAETLGALHSGGKLPEYCIRF